MDIRLLFSMNFYGRNFHSFVANCCFFKHLQFPVVDLWIMLVMEIIRHEIFAEYENPRKFHVIW